jgi:hypothetical protein
MTSAYQNKESLAFQNQKSSHKSMRGNREAILSYSNIAEPQVMKIRTISTEEGSTAN